MQATLVVVVLWYLHDDKTGKEMVRLIFRKLRQPKAVICTWITGEGNVDGNHCSRMTLQVPNLPAVAGMEYALKTRYNAII